MVNTPKAEAAGAAGAGASGWSKSQFHVIDYNPKPSRGQDRRDPPGADVHPSGLCPLNTAGSDLIREIARDLGLDQFGVRVGGNDEANQAACWIVRPGTPGAMALRENVDRKTFTIYLHELFKARPKLRPDATRWCAVSREVDDDGDPFILISLSMALERHRSRRKATEPAPAPQA